MSNESEFTVGEFCAGIGGFGLGFEQAGWTTKWQVELDDINRACLADRFPHARQHTNLLDWRRFGLCPVRCIAFGSPCQDISVMGGSKRDKSRQGLEGSRSGLFFAIMEAVAELRPQFIAFENVPSLVNSNGGRDFQEVIRAFAQCGYVGHGRVLNAQYFGIPQNRRRLVMVAGLGRKPSWEFMADAGPMVSLPSSCGEKLWGRPSDGWAAYTLTSAKAAGRINICSEIFVAEEGGWDSMVERGRETEVYGLSTGLDGQNLAQAYAAGNAFPPPMARWVAEILKRS